MESKDFSLNDEDYKKFQRILGFLKEISTDNNVKISFIYDEKQINIDSDNVNNFNNSKLKQQEQEREKKQKDECRQKQVIKKQEEQREICNQRQQENIKENTKPMLPQLVGNAFPAPSSAPVPSSVLKQEGGDNNSKHFIKTSKHNKLYAEMGINSSSTNSLCE